MKYKLLSVSTESEINIGDYIQALASSQFLPSIDGFIQREKLKQYNEEEAMVIMNGWYMHHPENWPPSNLIHPLFVAFHINSLAKETLLAKESILYLKKNEPIGCRDINTAHLLQEAGVNAYFSGCMTLTLGYKYSSKEKENQYYFVDSHFVTNWNLKTLLYNGFYLMTHYKSISIIAKKYPGKKSLLRKKMILTTFYREYRKCFSDEILINANYINQQSKEWKAKGLSDAEYLKEAEMLVKKYARAKLVVTSRIHCALPCLGLGTSVVYIEDKNQSEASSCRLDGLRELFIRMLWNKDHLEDVANLEKITANSIPKNKEEWEVLSNNLIKKCQIFIRK